jgi:hypothetical protein
MIVTLIILGFIVAVLAIATVLVVRSDSPGSRPYREVYDSRCPQ